MRIPAIQEVLCGRCEEPTAEPISEVRRGEMPCGPCRAETSGTVYLVAPDKAMPYLVTSGIWREDQVMTAGPVGPRGGEAIQQVLAVWCEALMSLAMSVNSFSRHLMETSPEERVADAVMGEEPLAGTHLHTHPGDTRALILEGLPPQVARKLVQATFAAPPSPSRWETLR